MGMTWTDDQRKVIELRDRNILVSAAAGSGKTAVLVERIIKIITDKEHPVDIDRLLIVTFTNAAAAEMRERIGNALENALKEQPDDEHLQRQLSLLHNAQITTIDSFCLYVIRNHFETETGIGIQGILPTGDVTILKCGGECLDEYYLSTGTLTENTNYINMCRTQVRVKMNTPADYFLKNPLGNHHILLQGNYENSLNEFLMANSCKRTE